MRTVLGAAGVALLLLASCTHDFGTFEPLLGEGGESGADEGGSGDDGAIPDSGPRRHRDSGASDGHGRDGEDAPADAGPCTPSSSCLDTAKTCLQGCNMTLMSCQAMCSMMGSKHCWQGCRMADQTCTSGCVSTCTSCASSAGCPDPGGCQAVMP